jgi:hypothetical protein
MTNKQIYIGLGLLAVTIVGVIIYKKRNKKEEEKSGFMTSSDRMKCNLNGGVLHGGIGSAGEYCEYKK